jgi:protein-disulfide isomerase
VRADDPVRGLATAPHTVVVFSDFLCPACRNFAGFFKSDIQPLYGSRIRLVYKHLPLDAACNPKLPQSLHPGACDAAYAAEAARELGGPDAFWKMHDTLFEHQEAAKAGHWAELAKSAGLDGAAVADRVAKHSHADAMSLKLKGTPGVFIDGRMLDEWNNTDLWKTILAPPATPH